MRAMNMEKKMRKTNILRVAGLLTLVLFGLAVAVPAVGAAVLLHEDFEGRSSADGSVYGGRFTSGKTGQGWQSSVEYYMDEYPEFLEYNFDGGSLGDEGTIEFFLKRQRSTLIPGIVQEGIVELLDENYRPILNVVVLWDNHLLEDGNKGDSALLVYGNGLIEDLGSEPWGGDIFPLGRKIGTGNWMHVAVTWGANRNDHNVYVDGKPLSTVINKYGKNYRAKSTNVASLLAETAYIRIGTETQSSSPDQTWSPLSNSVVDELKVHDIAFNPYRETAPVTEVGIASVEHDALRQAGFSGALVAGDDVTVTLEGTSGATASFDVARLADIRGEIPLSWQGYGVYMEEKVFFDEGEVDLGDVDEYRVYVSTSPIGGITEDTPFVEALDVEEQSYVADGLDTDVPYYVAVMALMDDGSLEPVIGQREDLAMTEVDGSPGLYEGILAVDYGDRYREAVVVARLSAGETTVSVIGEEVFAIDSTLNISVNASPEELKADEESESEVTVTVTDANGEPVSDREIRFLLATTSQYTGVVGGGRFAEEVGGSLGREFTATTDLFGQAEMTYTAGFAAKTAIIVARDMVSNSTGAGYVKTYITATAELELEAVQEVAGKALGYSITVTSSDEWLTADGESEARITALVTKDGIPVEGHRVGFSVSSGSGKIRTVQGVTGSDGEARAVYTAGKRIGVALIRALDHTVGITGAVQIELRSDAPAKIAITLTPDLLPADGRSTADVEVVVTDINDNPNEGVEVEYDVAIGSGRLRRIDNVTDDDGVSTAEYVAGRIPGKVSIGVTVRSTEPTDEEFAAARALATAVSDTDFF